MEIRNFGDVGTDPGRAPYNWLAGWWATGPGVGIGKILGWEFWNFEVSGWAKAQIWGVNFEILEFW